MFRRSSPALFGAIVAIAAGACGPVNLTVPQSAIKSALQAANISSSTIAALASSVETQAQQSADGSSSSSSSQDPNSVPLLQRKSLSSDPTVGAGSDTSG
jgi:hypothetical protein